MTHPTTLTDRYRPLYHFTPQRHWLNDPNGLVYFEGEYHLFYQHNPHANAWGNMSWGHAVSTDLVHWEHLPVALLDDGEVMVFSGCAVVDWQNTSGLGTDGQPPLVILYTGHHRADERQAQYLAFSTDRGRTWTRLGPEPVLDIGARDFRDPKVFWHAPTARWIMVLVRASDHRVAIYGSPDLRGWTHLSDFGPAGHTGGVWEVPDLFELPVEGDPDRTAWVLKVDLNPGGPWGGSGCQYWVGSFDGTSFAPDGPERWADHGSDFYAAITWSDLPGRRVWLGWMSNWQYAGVLPTEPWRGALTLPRELSLRDLSGRLTLVQRPVPELTALRGEGVALRSVVLDETSAPAAHTRGPALEIVAEFEPGDAAEFGLHVCAGDGHETTVGYDATTGRVFVDRSRAGDGTFHPEFAGRHEADASPRDGVVRLHVFVDRSSVEVFCDGTVVLTDLVFPHAGGEDVVAYARGGRAVLRSFDAWPLDGTSR